jgi:preprotein translocase subunit SecY
MSKFLENIKHMFQDRSLRRQILFVLGALVVFRLFSAIPIPGVNQMELAKFLDNSQFFGLLNVFSGGGLSILSIVMLGVGPYITSSIIMQLLTMMSPKLKSMYSEEGAIGRRKFSQYSRLLTVPLAFAQAFGFIVLLQRQGIVAQLGQFDLFTNVMVVVAGSIFLMWLGEIMTEFGIGNGLSIIIFAGIVSQLPQVIQQAIFTFDASQLPIYLMVAVLGIIVIYGVVLITEAERSIPVTYAKQVRGGGTHGGSSTYLPLRLNQAGVIPIIFAISILLLPQMIFGALSNIQSYPIFATINSAIKTFTALPWL